MNRVRLSFASDELSTYRGPITFLDDQSSFDSIFGNNLTILHITRRSVGTCAIEDTTYLGEVDRLLRSSSVTPLLRHFLASIYRYYHL